MGRGVGEYLHHMGQDVGRLEAGLPKAGQPEDGIHHYEDVSEVPQETLKYWHQRYDIFSKYDEGIWMTDDAWFGITPEPVATKIAEHLAKAAPPERTVLIDAFGGAGGNSIAFALSGRWEQIFVVEKDAQVLKCAKHNAEVYGVKNKIFWVLGDSFEVIPKRFKSMGRKAVIFASPPWGGPGYREDAIFNLSTMQPYSLDQLFKCYSKITTDVALYLPRTSNLNQIAKYAKEDTTLQVMHYCMQGASKALCVYYGNFLEFDN